jgi:uracil permease
MENVSKKSVNNWYLPNEKPPFFKLILFSLQILIAVLPATIVVPLLTGFDVATTIFASGFATLCFIGVTKGKVPLYIGSSFSYIGAMIALMSVSQFANLGQFDKIAIATFGIAASGVINILAGILVNKIGMNAITKVITPTLTGSIAMSIGATLTANAVGDALGSGNYGLVVALITLLSIILFSVYLRGFFQQISLLLGILVGVGVSYLVLQFAGVSLFRDVIATSTTLLTTPHFVLPIPNWEAVIALGAIAIATIPESFAHSHQIDTYVDELADEKGKNHSGIKNMIGTVLIGDGVADIASSVIGGVGGTSYGEAISVMSITKVYSIYTVIGASILAIAVSFFTPFINAIYAIPATVIGGVEIVCFGGIIAQGIAIMKDKVDFFSPKDILTVASISVIAIGGQFYQGGVLPIFGMQIPCIAGAAIFGIILNCLLNFKK